MKVDVENSRYRESESATEDFDRDEVRRLRLLLRRLRFLETQVNANGGLGSATGAGGAAFAEWELEALEWVLCDELGYAAKGEA